MGARIWNLYAPVYEWVMRSEKQIYDYMYAHIAQAVKDLNVLEIATGPGLIANHIASSAKSVVGTDFSPKMIEQARKRAWASNVRFEVADACALPYKDASFDVVVIANALHLIPNPEKALAEIDRVLVEGGLLIAPNFLISMHGHKLHFWPKLLRLIGIHFVHAWDEAGYKAFLLQQGLTITQGTLLKGRIDLYYAECVRRKTPA